MSYRDSVAEARLAELETANRAMAEELARLRFRHRALAWFRTAVRIVLIQALAGAIGYGYSTSVAVGAAARANAEREARAAATRMTGHAPYSVVCVDSDRVDVHVGDYLCAVYRTAGEPWPLNLSCDDDPLQWNNGCTPLEPK